MTTYMGEEAKKKLAICGKGVIVHPFARIANPEVVEIGDCSQIDDFTFINGGKGVKIGRFCHIASFVAIVGGGFCYIGDYVSVSTGSKLITRSAKFDGSGMVGSPIPAEFKAYHESNEFIHIGRNAIIGSMTTILPGIIVDDYAGTGAGTVITKDIPIGEFHVGIPNRFHCKRDVKTLMEKEREVMKIYG